VIPVTLKLQATSAICRTATLLRPIGRFGTKYFWFIVVQSKEAGEPETRVDHVVIHSRQTLKKSPLNPSVPNFYAASLRQAKPAI